MIQNDIVYNLNGHILVDDRFCSNLVDSRDTDKTNPLLTEEAVSQRYGYLIHRIYIQESLISNKKNNKLMLYNDTQYIMIIHDNV